MGGGEVQRANRPSSAVGKSQTPSTPKEIWQLDKDREERLLVRGYGMRQAQFFKLGIIFKIRESHKLLEESTRREERTKQRANDNHNWHYIEIGWTNGNIFKTRYAMG